MTVWLVQYKHAQDREFEQRLVPGLREKWQIHPFKPNGITRDAEEGDLVVIWRTKDDEDPEGREADDGGVIGWGRVRLADRAPDDDHLPFDVTHAFPMAPIPRQEIIGALKENATKPNNWPGQVSLRKLPQAEAVVFQEFRSQETLPEPPQSQWHPLASGHPPDWANGWGQDEYGVFVEITVQDVSQRLRWCPPGRFLMGSPNDEPERLSAEGPRTEITFGEGFWLFETTVTQAFYHAVTKQEPSRFKGQGFPVEYVSWTDAQDFLDAINDAHPGLDLRLPSEAEWEYACRAGSTTPFEPSVARRHTGMSITSDEVNHDGNYPYGEGVKGEYRAKTVAGRNAGFRPEQMGFLAHAWKPVRMVCRPLAR